jgi:predicted site-specific integrase-resolvase
MANEISVSEWAKLHGVAQRTAFTWAKRGLIPTEIREKVITKTTHERFILENTQPPDGYTRKKTVWKRR